MPHCIVVCPTQPSPHLSPLSTNIFPYLSNPSPAALKILIFGVLSVATESSLSDPSHISHKSDKTCKILHPLPKSLFGSLIHANSPILLQNSDHPLFHTYPPSWWNNLSFGILNTSTRLNSCRLNYASGSNFLGRCITLDYEGDFEHYAIMAFWMKTWKTWVPVLLIVGNWREAEIE